MHRPLAAQRRRVLQLPLTQLVKLAKGIVAPPDERPGRERVFTSWITFWVFLSQVCSAAPTCREALRHRQAWLRSPKPPKKVSSSTSAYCQARARLPQAHLDQAFDGAVKRLNMREQALGLGRPVRVVDGSSCSMPDTAKNQETYPQPRCQKKGCGFPVMRFVAVFSLATGAVLGTAQGALSVHERTLWRQLWSVLKRGDIALADRGFGSYADYYLLLQRGVDSVMRLHQRRSKGVKKRKRLGKDDWLVEWMKATIRPKWMTPEQWRALPQTLQVRHVKVNVRIKGFRTKTILVATTLCNAKAYPAQALADLYRQRWMAELFLRDIKITMGMDVLRCKTPALIQKEFTMHLIAYNLVRALMLQAANRYGQNVLELSLAGALATIRQWAPSIAACPKNHRQAFFDDFLQCIAADSVPKRPNRLEPRARKRRPKNYQLLNKPRREYHEIQHRNRYVKALS